jgi:predicted DsbA family dithiol-disulfide isomerase
MAEHLATDAGKAEVLADVREAQELGISGVPFFVFGRRYALSGAQPPETILAALERTAAESSAG